MPLLDQERAIPSHMCICLPRKCMRRQKYLTLRLEPKVKISLNRPLYESLSRPQGSRQAL